MNSFTGFFFGPAPIVAFQSAVSPELLPLFRALSFFGEPWGLLIAAAVARWLFGRQVLYALLPLIAIEAASFLVFTNTIPIERPGAGEVTRYEQLSMNAFPSGHTYLATSVWGLFHFMGFFPLALAVALPMGVGIGRLYLGVHNVGDVAAGLAIGLLLAWAYSRAWRRVEPRLQRTSWKVWSAVAAAMVVATAASLGQVGTNPRWWAAGGLLIGTAIALPLEARWAQLRRPQPDDAMTTMLVRIGLPLGGIMVAAWLDLGPVGFGRTATALLHGGAALWALLIAPWLFTRWSGHQTGMPGKMERAVTEQRR